MNFREFLLTSESTLSPKQAHRQGLVDKGGDPSRPEWTMKPHVRRANILGWDVWFEDRVTGMDPTDKLASSLLAKSREVSKSPEFLKAVIELVKKLPTTVKADINKLIAEANRSGPTLPNYCVVLPDVSDAEGAKYMGAIKKLVAPLDDEEIQTRMAGVRIPSISFFMSKLTMEDEKEAKRGFSREYQLVLERIFLKVITNGETSNYTNRLAQIAKRHMLTVHRMDQTYEFLRRTINASAKTFSDESSQYKAAEFQIGASARRDVKQFIDFFKKDFNPTKESRLRKAADHFIEIAKQALEILGHTLAYSEDVPNDQRDQIKWIFSYGKHADLQYEFFKGNGYEGLALGFMNLAQAAHMEEGKSLNEKLGKHLAWNVGSFMRQFVGKDGQVKHRYSDPPNFEDYIKRNTELAKKTFAALQALGVRRMSRVPVMFHMQDWEQKWYPGSKTSVAGTFRPQRYNPPVGINQRQPRGSKDTYINIYGETSIWVLAHEVGHAVFYRLPRVAQDNLEALARTTPLPSDYASPDFVYSDSPEPVRAHKSGNEYFAEMVGLLATHPALMSSKIEYTPGQGVTVKGTTIPQKQQPDNAGVALKHTRDLGIAISGVKRAIASQDASRRIDYKNPAYVT